MFDDRRYCRPLRVAQGRPQLSSTIWQIDRRKRKGAASAGRPPRALAGSTRGRHGQRDYVRPCRITRQVTRNHGLNVLERTTEHCPGHDPGPRREFCHTERALSLSSHQGDTNVLHSERELPQIPARVYAVDRPEVRPVDTDLVKSVAWQSGSCRFRGTQSSHPPASPGNLQPSPRNLRHRQQIVLRAGSFARKKGETQDIVVAAVGSQ